MSVFPEAKFQVLLPNGALEAGRSVSGELVIDAPEPIPAEHINLCMRSTVWAGYGSDKSRSVVHEDIFFAPLHVDLPGYLAAGLHRYPFVIDVPAWLPEPFDGDDCGVGHRIGVWLDVDWAPDVATSVKPMVVQRPREANRVPVVMRSREGLYQNLVLEVTLASSVIAHGEALEGQIAIRAGHDARFDAISLRLTSVAFILMGRRDRRRGDGMTINVPAAVLRAGEPVPFRFPTNTALPPSFQTGRLDHQWALVITADVGREVDPSFEIPVEVLPRGSKLYGVASGAIIGSGRLRYVTAAMARASGLREGRLPVLCEGASGPVSIRVTDVGREGRLGVMIDLTFPDVELGTTFRQPHNLASLGTAALFPAPLRDGYGHHLDGGSRRVAVAPEALEAFFQAVLGELGKPDEVRMTDRSLALHYPIPNDEVERMSAIAVFAKSKADQVAAAIAALPFPPELGAHRATWQTFAATEGATLVPSGPAIHGVVVRARILGGEERALRASVRTIWSKGAPSTRLEIDLAAAPLPKAARGELEAEVVVERVRAIRALFPEGHVANEGQMVTLERPGFTEDPRAITAALDAVLAWTLDARGERRADSPYR
jgi:hypothetical protein